MWHGNANRTFTLDFQMREHTIYRSSQLRRCRFVIQVWRYFRPLFRLYTESIFAILVYRNKESNLYGIYYIVTYKWVFSVCPIEIKFILLFSSFPSWRFIRPWLLGYFPNQFSPHINYSYVKDLNIIYCYRSICIK